MKEQVIQDAQQQCFKVHLEGDEYALVRYELAPGVMTITSTRVPERLQGKGYGKVMMEAVLPLIEQQGFTIVPQCSYVDHYLTRHPQWQHLRHQS